MRQQNINFSWKMLALGALTILCFSCNYKYEYAKERQSRDAIMKLSGHLTLSNIWPKTISLPPKYINFESKLLTIILFHGSMKFGQ